MVRASRLPVTVFSFAAGASTATLTLNGTGDRTAEPDEAITVQLVNPTAPGTAVVAGSPSTTTILNDDVAGVSITQSGGNTAIVRSDAAAATSQGLIVYNSSNGKLFYNENKALSGFGQGSVFSVLRNAPTVATTDFVIQP